MSAYNKRAKGSWNVGKGHKHEHGAERQFSRREIQQQLDADEEDFLEKHKKAPKQDKRARLEYRIRWYEDAIKRWGHSSGMWLQRALDEHRAALKKLDEHTRKGII